MKKTDSEIKEIFNGYLEHLRFGRVPFVNYSPQSSLLAKAFPTALGMYFAFQGGNFRNGLLEQCETSSATEKALNSLLLTAAKTLGTSQRIVASNELQKSLKAYYYHGMRRYYALIKQKDVRSLIEAAFVVTHLYDLHHPDGDIRQGFFRGFLKEYHGVEGISTPYLLSAQQNADIDFLERLLPLLPTELFAGECIESEYSYSYLARGFGIRRSDLRVDTKLFEFKTHQSYIPKNFSVWRQLLLYGALASVEGRKPESLWVYYPLNGVVEVLIPQTIMNNTDFFFSSLIKDCTTVF